MNQNTPILLENKAREKILRGINAVYEAVRRTMGPQGGNALIYGLYSRPYRITNDGYTVAEVIELKDEHENLAANAIQDAAKRTNLIAGDGTTATAVIAGKLLNHIIPKVSSQEEVSDLERALADKGKSKGVMDIKRDMFKTRDEVLKKLKEMAKKVESVEELTKIATVSVENEEFGKIIAEMAWKVGKEGYIDVTDGFKGKVETELIEGARFPAKIAHKFFVNKPERYEMEMNDTPVLLTNYTIDQNILNLFFSKLQNLPKLTIIAPDFKETALKQLAALDKKHGDLIYAPVKVPSLKTVQFQDVEVYTGAKFINKDSGDKPENLTNNDLGFLSKFVVKDADVREDCLALGGKGTRKPLTAKKSQVESPVETRIRTLREQIENTREEGQKNLLRRRLASLSSSVGVIRVSLDSEGETYYWKKKIEDAVYACKAALEEGYVKGGGMALKEIGETLPEDDLLRPAIMACYEQIGENMENKNFEVGNDVIDAVKAIRCAVEHAVSVAANLATVKVIIPREREKTPAEGYAAIASAIRMFNLLWAKREAIDKENIEEIEKDNMAQHDRILRSVVD